MVVILRPGHVPRLVDGLQCADTPTGCRVECYARRAVADNSSGPGRDLAERWGAIGGRERQRVSGDWQRHVRPEYGRAGCRQHTPETGSSKWRGTPDPGLFHSL